jgi:hypothetical protein
MTKAAGIGEKLFWQLADRFLNDPGATRSTMMGYPYLRSEGAFFACVGASTGHRRLPDRIDGVRGGETP